MLRDNEPIDCMHAYSVPPLLSHMSSSDCNQGSVAAELPQAPYLDYSPLPGVVPPTSAPSFHQPWGCLGSNKCVVTASQPVIPVPVQQEILRKEKIIEVDQTIVTDKIQPKVWKQEVSTASVQIQTTCHIRTQHICTLHRG